MRLHFDDTIDTVLTTDASTDFGRQALWRQLVDLLGRRRAPVTRDAIHALHTIRADVPPPVRAASARALEFADPPPAIVYLMAIDELVIALPILRSARMATDDWIALLPRLTPSARSVLRGRRDLSPQVIAALEAWGPNDLVLPPSDAHSAESHAMPASVVEGPVMPTDPDAGAGSRQEGEGSGVAPPMQVKDDGSFVAVGSIAREMPIVALAFRRAEAQTPASVEEQTGEAESGTDAPAAPDGPFRIADVVARIDEYQRNREAGAPVVAPVRLADHFRFETDAQGVVRRVEGIERAPLIGLSLDFGGVPGMSRVDAGASGALRRRSPFSNARLVVEGDCEAAGDWLISATPTFDSRNGRFTGYRGTGRRPRRDEHAGHANRGAERAAAQQLRQLVHELRTPAGAISGFAEMIEEQYFGPVAQQYRERATEIRTQARDLVGVIEDLDLAARIADNALDLRPQSVALNGIFTEIEEELGALLTLRGASLAVPFTGLSVRGDMRAVRRLLARLTATLVALAGRGEHIAITIDRTGSQQLSIGFDRPEGLIGYPGDAEALDDEERDDIVTLGTGFALRLARNLARELGGALLFESDHLTLRLPEAELADMGQAHNI
ncbi:sensor histidine kinase [Stakelama sp. CBK3Z-3]|uniref:histidine kinase n=1 Tax=Stakelama flava TaxID=2860338 RepID=A0ABS6XKX6_9SPHN|nr:histidine kinase dimerization/phospho-acceptor domain-containing protein [Stakelama flava]MBW4330857.1 sensor histidine kinase [Stakelama flava]